MRRLLPFAAGLVAGYLAFELLDACREFGDETEVRIEQADQSPFNLDDTTDSLVERLERFNKRVGAVHDAALGDLDARLDVLEKRHEGRHEARGVFERIRQESSLSSVAPASPSASATSDAGRTASAPEGTARPGSPRAGAPYSGEAS